MINNADLVNGTFELLGAAFTLINVKQIIKDKQVKGVSVIPVVFFTLWGVWNCFFYPLLNLWLSFTGGLSIVIINAIWLFLFFKYKKK